MRVLVVTVVHVPTDARIHNRQIRSLAHAGHTVTYAAPFSATATATDLPGVQSAIDLPRATGRRRVAALAAARRVLAREPADIVLVHDPELLLAVGSRHRRTPVVWDVHEDTAAALSDRPWVPRWLRPAVGRWVRRLEGWAERRVHLLLAEDAYKERFARPHAVVRNLPWLPVAPVRRGQDRLVYVGRVSRGRGALDMVAAARALAPDVIVDVVGPIDHDVRPVLERAATEGVVRLRGPVANAEAMDLLDGALAGLSLLHDEPNYRHSMPTKVLEYAAAGLPTITTPLPEVLRAMDDGLGALVVPFEDPDAVVEAARRLRADPGLAARLGRAGRDATERAWSWDACWPEFVHLMEGWAERG